MLESQTSAANQTKGVRRHYGLWAQTYGTPKDDGWFSHVRAREGRIVQELLALHGRMSVLDAGCGPGLYSAALKRQGHDVWAVDLCPEMIDRVKGMTDQALVADIQIMRLGRTFDRILCLGVMEFVCDPVATLINLRNHLSADGLLVVLVPRCGFGGWIYQRQKRNHGLEARLYSSRELRLIARNARLSYVAHRNPFFHNLAMAFRGRENK
jgi:2-polyprenyl-3-methyl-5-hydroxy-6-metoxy-1,4-benzoquinol methylase